MFSAPEGDVSVDDLIDAVELTAGDDSVLVLQHMGGAKFLVCTRNASQATSLMVAEGFTVNGVKVPVEAVGPPVTYVNVYRYPAFLSDEALSNALAPFGKIKSISFATLATRQTKLNGVRLVKIEMSRPVPNFMTIAGHKVMCEYRGMRRVCARCGEVGHMATACSAAYCRRCGIFGHDTEGCEAECKRCGGHHGTRECFRRRSYASAARGFPTLTDTTPSLVHVSGPAVSKAASAPRLQVLSPRTAPRTIGKGLPPEDRNCNTGPPTGSSADTSSANEGEKPGSVDDVATTSSETDTSDLETVSAQSSPPTQPARPLGGPGRQGSSVAPKALTDASEQEAASLLVANPPTNVLAPVTPLDLEERSQDPAREDLPIVSRGYYVLPEVRAQPSLIPLPAPSSDHALPSLCRNRDPITAQTATGRDQRTRSRSRSRRRTGEGVKSDPRERATSGETKQRRAGLGARSSDSDAPPKAKSQKLGERAESEGDPPPQAGDSSA